MNVESFWREGEKNNTSECTDAEMEKKRCETTEREREVGFKVIKKKKTTRTHKDKEKHKKSDRLRQNPMW